MLGEKHLHRLSLFPLSLLLHHIILITHSVSLARLSQVYLFLREEDTPVGTVILSASHALYLARANAMREIYSVIIEDPMEPSSDYFYTETRFNMSRKNDYFSINELNGFIKTTKHIDFDDPALQTAGCVSDDTLQQNNLFSIKTNSYCCFPFFVTSSSDGDLNLKICIEDVNDNAPLWNLTSVDKSGFVQVSFRSTNMGKWFNLFLGILQNQFKLMKWINIYSYLMHFAP